MRDVRRLTLDLLILGLLVLLAALASWTPPARAAGVGDPIRGVRILTPDHVRVRFCVGRLR